MELQQSRPTIVETSQLPWLPPIPGLIKINVDATCKPNQRRCGIGAIFQNDKGEVMLTFAKPYLLIIEVEVMEAIAIRDALHIAKEGGFGSIVVESNLAKVIHMIRETLKKIQL